MRRLLIICMLFAGTPPLLSAQVSSSCLPPGGLEARYRNDISDLAMQRIYAVRSPDTSRIEAPQAWIDTALRILSAIANSGPRLESDSVFDFYCVSNWPYQSFMPSSIQVQVDTSYAWAKQWFNRNTVTGNAKVDDLLSTYGVTLTNYAAFSNNSLLNHWATLTASRSININAFADSLRRIPGVVRKQSVPTIGSGDQIRYSADSLHRIFFYAGWGDCPLGCTNSKSWFFSVDLRSCTVMLDSVRRYAGSPEARQARRCRPLSVAYNAAPKADLSPVVFPNPVRDILQVYGLKSGSQLRLTDLSGKTIASWYQATAGRDLRELKPGIYLIETTDMESKERRSFRIVKE